MLPQEAPGVTDLAARHLPRRTGHDHLATFAAPFRSQVDDVVRGLDHIQVVLDHDDGVAGIDEAVETV